jgi:hypothetical protein
VFEKIAAQRNATLYRVRHEGLSHLLYEEENNLTTLTTMKVIRQKNPEVMSVVREEHL